MTPTTHITYRPVTQLDHPFIYSTWLKGLYWGSEWFQMIPWGVYRIGYRNAIAAILTRNRGIVACLTEDPDVVVGYAIVSPDGGALHWAYVKRPWRKLGIARAMVPTFHTVTHLTKTGRAIMRAKAPDAIFNPFAI